MEHRNAPLTRTGRLRLVRLVVEDGLTFEAAAAASNVAKSTAWEWVSRWRAASEQERRTLVCLEGRSSRPRRSPRMLAGSDQERICAARRRTGWGPRLIASEVGIPHATVHRALRRHGLSRLPRPKRETVVRYEWPCPGDLLHMDTKRFQRFTRPGHAVTGDRHRTSADKRARPGHEFVHSIVDDHSRLAYSELHPDERARTVTAFTARALAFFESHGMQIKRLMTDNAFAYIHNRSLRELLAAHDIRHLTITLPATNKRQGRALPTNPQTRMGTRPDLPLLTPPSPSPDTLGQLLQRATPPLRTRRPPAHHPRSQPIEAGQLDGRRPPQSADSSR